MSSYITREDSTNDYKEKYLENITEFRFYDSDIYNLIKRGAFCERANLASRKNHRLSPRN